MHESAVPRACVIIPARGGSKGIPGKNLQHVNGFSLLARAITVGRRVQYVSRLLVTTDSQAIAEEASQFGAEAVMRPDSLASDLARSESALLHAMEVGAVTHEVIVFLECTSPFINHLDIEQAIHLVASGQYDSVFSAARTDVLLWKQSEAGCVPVGHNPTQQTTRQERPPTFLETGAFYVFRKRDFVRFENRFFGRIGYVEVDPRHAIEVDYAHDLEAARLYATTIDSQLGYFSTAFS